MTSQEYARYLQSPHWAGLKQQLFSRRPKVCEICESPDRIHVHHVRYRRPLIATRVEDLMPVCSRCHDLIHSNRELKRLRETDIWKMRWFTWRVICRALGIKGWEARQLRIELEIKAAFGLSLKEKFRLERIAFQARNPLRR